MSQYTWIWEGRTQKGNCTWWTEDGRSGDVAWTQAIEDDIIEKTKATYYATVVAEFVKQCNAQGITASLVSVDVQCEIVKDPLQTSGYYVARGERYHTNYSQSFYVKVIGTVIFDSEQDLVGSPIAPALVVAIGKAIALIILALGIAWGIYEFLRNLTLSQTTSTVTVRKYDEQGNLISETTETITKQEPSPTAWVGLIVLAGVVIGALVVLPSLLEKKGRKR